ncbi:MAG: PaaI family thioesterase [Acidobacteriota bacterium]
MTQMGEEKLRPLAHNAQNRCFGCGDANPVGLHLEFMLAESGAVVCNHTVGDLYEGPKGYVHGGLIATLLDETMSKAMRSHGLVAMTRHMSVDYLRPVPSTAPIRLEGALVRSEGRKHWAEARILDASATVLAHAKGLFVEVQPRREKPLPTGESNPHG